jgi:hypothetical protein
MVRVRKLRRLRCFVLSWLHALYLIVVMYLFFYRFCGLKGHEMFCEVERSYIEDGFNLYGLRTCVSNFSDCLDLILDRIGPDDSDDSRLTQSACTLYGLIHARYIITAHGLDAMYNKVSRALAVFIVNAEHMSLQNLFPHNLERLTGSLFVFRSMLPKSLGPVLWSNVLVSQFCPSD